MGKMAKKKLRRSAMWLMAMGIISRPPYDFLKACNQLGWIVVNGGVGKGIALAHECRNSDNGRARGVFPKAAGQALSTFSGNGVAQKDEVEISGQKSINRLRERERALHSIASMLQHLAAGFC
jgi:hypothetical protein